MTGRLQQKLRQFLLRTDGSNAIEFSILAMPFILVLVGLIQVGIYFMAQAALDIGVVKTAEGLRNQFYDEDVTSSSYPNAAALKTKVANYAGGLITNNSGLAVEIQPITSLNTTNKNVVDGTNSYGGSNKTSILALRAQSTVPTFLPGVSGWKVFSSTLVRRQGR